MQLISPVPIQAPISMLEKTPGFLGTVTLSQMLHELANHDLGHLTQIAELYRAHTFYPHVGPFQKYSNPRP